MVRIGGFRGRRIDRNQREGVIPKAGGPGSDPLQCAHRFAQKEKAERRWREGETHWRFL